MILFIDNYDSFTYNLVDYLGQLESNVFVSRNDKISIDRIGRLNPRGIVLSPGPGTPENAGICREVVQHYYRRIPILGVCLGHQCIASIFGARIVRAPYPVHGKVSEIHHNGKTIFSGLPSPFEATRYHSLLIDEATLPNEIEVTARSQDGLIMAIEHREYCVTGVQFHPESILTNYGFALLQNWLEKIVYAKKIKNKKLQIK